MNLLNDVARCDGKTVKAENPLHQECDDCARRIAPRPEYVWMMGAPEFVKMKINWSVILPFVASLAIWALIIWGISSW